MEIQLWQIYLVNIMCSNKHPKAAINVSMLVIIYVNVSTALLVEPLTVTLYLNFNAPYFISNASELHHFIFLLHGFAFYCSVTDNLSDTSEMPILATQPVTANITKYLQIVLKLKHIYL